MPFSGTSRPANPTTIAAERGSPPIRGPVASAASPGMEAVEVDAERDDARRPAKPFGSVMRAASVLQAEMPAAVRSARRSNQRKGIG